VLPVTAPEEDVEDVEDVGDAGRGGMRVYLLLRSHAASLKNIYGDLAWAHSKG
jgi:hypothetical protein